MFLNDEGAMPASDVEETPATPATDMPAADGTEEAPAPVEPTEGHAA